METQAHIIEAIGRVYCTAVGSQGTKSWILPGANSGGWPCLPLQRQVKMPTPGYRHWLWLWPAADVDLVFDPPAIFTHISITPLARSQSPLLM